MGTIKDRGICILVGVEPKLPGFWQRNLEFWGKELLFEEEGLFPGLSHPRVLWVAQHPGSCPLLQAVSSAPPAARNCL